MQDRVVGILGNLPMDRIPDGHDIADPKEQNRIVASVEMYCYDINTKSTSLIYIFVALSTPIISLTCTSKKSSDSNQSSLHAYSVHTCITLDG